MAIDKKYLEEAKQMLMGGYENQRVQLNNSFNQNVQSLEGQKAGVNQNFDNQLQQNAINTTRSVNQYGNNTLARGLGRSTVATSGQAGIRDSGNRIANQVNDQRTAALGNLEAQKTLLQQSLQESLLGLTRQQESDSMDLARRLEQTAYDRAWQREQFEYQKSRVGSGGGYSGGSGGSRASNYSESQMWSEFNKLMNDDIKNGTYEAGRFAQTMAKYDPSLTEEMMRIYNQSRAKKGMQSQQTKATSKNKVNQVY